MARIRDDSWKDDANLKNELSMKVRAGLERVELLNYMERDFPKYAWSIRTLARRLQHFDIQYTDRAVGIDEIKQAVQNELDGPGKLLGYRAMHKKVRQIHDLYVPRGVVYDVMFELDPQGLEDRKVGCKKVKKKGHFKTRGINWVHSLDGHDKLMGYQNSTFPLAVYGCIDTASRKIIWIKVWMSNSDPALIGRWYVEYLYEEKMMASTLRLDKGSETGTMATIHAFLRKDHSDMNGLNEADICSNTVVYGPSTSNQIERWWKELHERLEKFYKIPLHWLLDNGHYCPDDEIDRMLLAYMMVPMMQQEINIFKDVVWNSHRIRAQHNTYLPDGIPDHIYDFPGEYGLEDCGWKITDDKLREVALMSGVLEVENDFLEEDFRQKCEQIIKDPLEIKPNECIDAFLFLKVKFSQLQTS